MRTRCPKCRALVELSGAIVDDVLICQHLGCVLQVGAGLELKEVSAEMLDGLSEESRRDLARLRELTVLPAQRLP